jgi:hypothetical protein
MPSISPRSHRGSIAWPRGPAATSTAVVVRQTIVEMEKAFLVVTAAGQGASLALLADADADLGMVAYEMNLMVKRVGTYLSSRPRQQPSMDQP